MVRDVLGRGIGGGVVTMPGTFWHYCCDHSAYAIVKDGYLKPGPDGYVWITDLHPPMRDALGLTMHTIKCDRMAYEFRVADNDGIIPWIHLRRELNPEYVEGLESAYGARPMHWFVSLGNVPISVAQTFDTAAIRGRIAGKTKSGPAVRKHWDPGPSHDAQIKETS